MDNFLDNIWGYIELFLNNLIVFLNKILSPLEPIGPWFIIFVLAFSVFLFTRVMARFYVTKRYKELEKKFHHWKDIREQAMKHPDMEKGKTLAKNIDQAQLNRVYYDYFFEGLLKNFISNVIPILLTSAYIIKVYTQEALLSKFGAKWIFSFSLGSTQVNISSLFWFIICLILSFILYLILTIVFKKQYGKK